MNRRRALTGLPPAAVRACPLQLASAHSSAILTLSLLPTPHISVNSGMAMSYMDCLPSLLLTLGRVLRFVSPLAAWLSGLLIDRLIDR